MPSDVPEINFQITEDKLNTGLRGFPVGTCWTSAVDPQAGVTYVGYPVAELAHLPAESVIFLLFEKHLPSDKEAAVFRREIAERAPVPQEVFVALEGFPKAGSPMEWFSGALQLLGMAGKTGDYREDALNMIAQVPAVLAAIFRIREGWGPLINSEPTLGYVANFVHMLGVPGGDALKLTHLLNIHYVLHMDHGGGNLSTFVGKAVASGLANAYQAMASAMNGLAGPRHGLANQDCFAMVREIDSEDEAEVERKLRDRIDGGQLLYGFGHAVLRQEDPRARVEFEVGEEICPEDYYFRVVKAVRRVGVKVLKENPKVTDPYPNVDLVSGSLLNAVGFKQPEYYTTLFGWARVAGIGAQMVDERQAFRNGRGVPIYRPRYVGVRQAPRSLKDD